MYMSMVVLMMVCSVLCITDMAFSLNQTGDFVYKGDVSYTNKPPALSEDSGKPEVNTLSYCAAQCRLQTQCKVVEICNVKDTTLCRLCNYTNPTFTSDASNVCQHLELVKESFQLSEMIKRIESLEGRTQTLESNKSHLEERTETLFTDNDNLHMENIKLWGNISNLQQPGSPDTIAFSAYRSINWEGDKNTYQDVIFDGTYFNFGNAYNSSTGYFTAPSNGIYLFSWTTIVRNRKLFDSQIEVNGKNQGLLNCNNELNDSVGSCTNTTPLILKKNDTVNIKKRIGNFMSGFQWSSFKGLKIY